ncbi:MAG: cation transporter [Flavobacteriales bacterium]|jgi:copper chaperone CopZ|nr:cation transporter [Flavobacteriales bacterium]MCB0758295.1 cation transporter [Flavobacteriales bacterium]
MKNQLFILSVLLLVACGQGSSADQAAVVADRTVKEVTITEGEPMATADMSIGGMTCQMMCANMIKSTLAKVPGVTSAEVVYADGDEIGHAKVTYDPAKVDDAQLVSAVQALADGQYTVSSIAIVKEVKQAPSASRRVVKENDEVSASIIPEVPMPNLVATLLALVRI